MTNGGGASEEDRSKRLTEQLGFEVRPKTPLFRRSCYFKITTSTFMQSHTILKSSTHKYANRPVLVLGGRGDILRKVAERCKKMNSLVSHHLMTTGNQLRSQTRVYNFGHQGMELPVGPHSQDPLLSLRLAHPMRFQHLAISRPHARGARIHQSSSTLLSCPDVVLTGGLPTGDRLLHGADICDLRIPRPAKLGARYPNYHRCHTVAGCHRWRSSPRRHYTS